LKTLDAYNFNTFVFTIRFQCALNTARDRDENAGRYKILEDLYVRETARVDCQWSRAVGAAAQVTLSSAWPIYPLDAEELNLTFLLLKLLGSF